jgi:hypothetical protein
MAFLLKLKQWQLFLILFGIPFFVDFVKKHTDFLRHNTIVILTEIPILMFLFINVLLGWIYTIGTTLYKKLPIGTPMNLIKFKLFLFFSAVYTVLITFLMEFVFPYFFIKNPLSFSSYLIIYLLNYFAVFCIIYCIYFISKAIKTVEWQRQVTFRNYAMEFILIYLFPIGIWYIQPRINVSLRP